MTEAPRPEDEDARLRELHALRILDTPPEERFDSITRMAAELFGVPIALVSLVDSERQWFKSALGLSARQTPRSVSFCAHALHSPRAFVVEDALLDPRFADNPLVTSNPLVRFYAGAVLKGPSGQALGTLCIIDHQPRRFQQVERQRLEDLSRWASLELNYQQLSALSALQSHDLRERKRADTLKDEFVSMVSHELRTPITSINGALRLLQGGAVGTLDEPARNLLELAINNCERLVRLVNDILDVEKIESGNMQFDLRQQPLLPVLEQAIAMTQSYAAQFQVHLRLLEPADCLLQIDADRITQVLINLLSNAAKFSPAGSTVEVRVIPSPELLRIAIRDHGPGIPEEFRSRIFQKFAQAKPAAHTEAGTGLGLAICKAIIDRHGGALSYTSKAGQGTEFCIDLPLPPSHPQDHDGTQ